MSNRDSLGNFPGDTPTSSPASAAAAARGGLAEALANAVNERGNDNSNPSPATADLLQYPLPAYLKFCPGGITYLDANEETDWHLLSQYPDSATGAGTISSPNSGGLPAGISLHHFVTGTGTVTYQANVLASRSRSRANSSESAGTSGAASPALPPAPPVGIYHARPDALVAAALQADERLRQYTLLSASNAASPGTSIDPKKVPHFLPSLSVLAEAAFGRLTGCAPQQAREWADTMVLSYLEDDDRAKEFVPTTEDDIFNSKPKAAVDPSSLKAAASRRVSTSSRSSQQQQHIQSELTTITLLKRLLQKAEEAGPAPGAAGDNAFGGPTYRPRPCGYVFKRGDIAWNCRTCQTDGTCVICDNCFRNSNHEGHGVYFHRTTPGGCCDCGDAEAWKLEGCCDRHRPHETDTVETYLDDPMEAVRTCARGQKDGIETLQTPPTALPPRFTAALAVVIGAAVQCLVSAIDGSGVGADPSQWNMRWADEAARIANGACWNEDYSYRSAKVTLTQFLGRSGNSNATTMMGGVPDLARSLPDGYRLQLRLHNDDVHTFDEVIDALHEPRPLRRAQSADDPTSNANPSLVTQRDQATEMTHHVDADGQVTVKSYSNTADAMSGFRRLKSRGLHCAVVSTAQVHMEKRARYLAGWLSEISAAHPVAAVLVVHALVQVSHDHDLAGYRVWREARMIPPWAGMDIDMGNGDEDVGGMQVCRRRFNAFPPHLPSSYVTREEAELLHGISVTINSNAFVELTGADPTFYSNVPYRLPSERYRKSPHALWGCLPSHYWDPVPQTSKHPLLHHLATGQYDPSIQNDLLETVYVVDTDLRKQQEADRITSSVFPHKLPGLNVISGVGTLKARDIDARRPPMPSPMDLRHLLATCSFRAPMSPILLLLLLDPYPTKQLRGAIHALFLSLLTDSRFKCRFAGALGIAYRPLSTLFCAGVGTEADTPLHFTVQIFTAGSLVRALGSAAAAEKLLLSDLEGDDKLHEASIGVFISPIAHTIVRCIHTNLLGATKEVNMILNNAFSVSDDNSQDEVARPRNDSLIPALTYIAGEHCLTTILPAAPDDGFLDSRSTRHKRLPHLLRDLEYVIETPGTAIRLLLPQRFPVYQGPTLTLRGEDVLSFSTVFARMLRLAQGMDPQKRKISGGHVEYEQNRWLEAFGLTLNFAGTRDALAESPTSGSTLLPVAEDGSHLIGMREAMGNLLGSLVREMKLWLYREGMLETGLPVPSSGPHAAMDLAQVEALQRSTLHVSGSHASIPDNIPTNINAVALSCATGVKMTEAQLSLIESALKAETAERLLRAAAQGLNTAQAPVTSGPVMGDWLRVPHSPLAGDSLSFHLPLHRALAKCVRSVCSVIVPDAVRTANPRVWWKLPVLDDDQSTAVADPQAIPAHPLVPVIRSTLRSSNCRVVWTAGPDCSSQEAQRRRSRSRTVSANIAVAKIIHSLADHPIRCLAAAQQIERHLWARNGSSVAGMAMNYSSVPLCRSFRDLDLLLVQLSASGMSVGLGARRVFSLLLSRFSMDGYLCDPERRTQLGSPTSSNSYASGYNIWVNPPRLQDPEHAVVLSESFFSILCVIVTELPPPPPESTNDDISLKQSIRRELLHALAAEPRSRSEAVNAASIGIVRREVSDGSSGTNSDRGMFEAAFTEVLNAIGKQKSQGTSRASSGPPAFELKPECCDEYDPTFFHLRRPEHQHAMDVVARLRKLKWGTDKDAVEAYCLPIVCAPPKAHPRFLACRLLLHLPATDAALRRALLFALTGGSWLPPSEPVQKPEIGDEMGAVPDQASLMGSPNASAAALANGEIPVVSTFVNRRILHGQPPGFLKRAGSDTDGNVPFSKEVVSSSSVSFLEVLQLLTLQVHTLEECASLHRTLPDLDEETRNLSSALSINSYLGRLVRVPESLADVWALKPYPDGPLKSRGSGDKRGSILGLLIALYENRSGYGAGPDSEGADFAQGEEEHGGARVLASSGLKWLLRFVNALVDGAPSVGAAVKSATTGIPFRKPTSSPTKGESGSSWTINENVRSNITGMLTNLPDLWPKIREKSAGNDNSAVRSKEAGKAAQQKMLDMMKRKQLQFAATIAPTEAAAGKKLETDNETDLCIICRCDDADGENNGPLGYLGHVQRSRVSQLRATTEASHGLNGEQSTLYQTYRVIGHMGCQLRESEAMDSAPLTCLPKGSVVTVLQSKVSSDFDILSRRVHVRHVAKDQNTGEERLTEGWASVQSSQGYVILSPLHSLCYSNTRWGSTRPIIKQCGHAAHLKCVETHTLSLHQRAAGDQPYDGRFAANISDGEFLCPLCKQLSNILIPRDSFENAERQAVMDVDNDSNVVSAVIRSRRSLFTGAALTKARPNIVAGMGRKALVDFGSHLHNAMSVPWERSTGSRKKQKSQWNPAILKWDFEEEVDGDFSSQSSTSVESILRLLRQQLIAWAAVGHSASGAEAGSRGIEEVLPFGILSQITDPWTDFNEATKDNHPLLLELKRTLTGTSGLLEVLCLEMTLQLGKREGESGESSIVGTCLADIIDGWSWSLGLLSRDPSSTRHLALWSELTALMASMPCHVARDGVIPQRCEARATAAEMWSVKGVGTEVRYRGDPPVPLAIKRLFEESPDLPAIPRDWGTMKPFVQHANDPSVEIPRIPFRPAVSGAFLYTPLLGWDMNTLAGAAFSTVLVNEVRQLPSSAELLDLSRTLIIGRMIQAVVTPGGLELPDQDDLDDDEECWSDSEIGSEGAALVKLVTHCRAMVKTKSMNPGNKFLGQPGDIASEQSLLVGVGRSILPFCRVVILLLRACAAAIRERKSKTVCSSAKPSAADKLLDSILFNADMMSCEDGFRILKSMQGPVPSHLVDTSGEWWQLINRWLTAIIGFELHHGSRGYNVVSRINHQESGRRDADTGVDESLQVISSEIDGQNRKAIDFEGDAVMLEVRRNTGRLEQGVVLAVQQNGGLNGPSNFMMNDDLDDSDEDLGGDVDMYEAEDNAVFPNQLLLGMSGAQNLSGNEDNLSSDENSESGSEGNALDSDREFAHVSRSPIITYQPSLLATEEIGPGRHGVHFEFSSASRVMSDLSHFGMVHRKDTPTFCLIRLPKSFVELYNIVNKVKGREDTTALDESEEIGNAETAICLLTGAVMRSGSSRRTAFNRAQRPPGACTLHARKTGSGIGIFFLVQKCTVLLMHNNKSAYSPSLYVDEHGEEDPGLRRGRPLFLNEARYRSLELLWRQQGIPREVAQIRSTSDRVIRDNWY